MRHDNFIHPLKAIKYRGRLPHWQADDATYFVTFRLRDSLPADVTQNLLREREQLARACSTAAERAQVDAAFALRLDHELDRGYGSGLLCEHGEIVAKALRHFDGERYELYAWCVMPNHVHVLLHVANGEEVPRILHSWKSYASHEIGRGVIWQREYFDRLIRTADDYVLTREYIRANPGRAGLVDWPLIG